MVRRLLVREELMNIRDWQTEVHETSKNHGWWEGANHNIIPEKLMLIVSEISEALEEYRNGRPLDEVYFSGTGKPEGFGVELADAVIRILDLASWLELDMEHLIDIKNEYNKSREFRHGNKLA